VVAYEKTKKETFGMKRTSAAILGIFLSASSFSQTTDQMVNFCQSSDLAMQGICRSFVGGFVSGYALTTNVIYEIPKSTQKVCIPKNPTPQIYIDAFLQVAKENPKLSDKGAATTMAISLTEKFPCKMP